jgi:(R,R)-butanediol dehydrogenase / meso-butanediol dehydrogenase / diacetyl reductase
MKALKWYGGKDIRYENVPEPSPGPGELKVKINLAGICGSDLKKYTDDTKKVSIILGHEFAGIVTELGKGVTDFKVGDRVTAGCYWYCRDCFYCKRGLYNLCLNSSAIGTDIDGCMAEYFAAPSHAFFKLPDTVPDELGTLVEPLAVGLHAVRQGNVRPGDTVVIVGAGTIGLGTLLAARAAGASKVYSVDKIEGRLKVASTLGATGTVLLSDGDPTTQIMNLTDNLGVDIAFECVGRPETPQLAVNLARRGGTVVIVGLFEKPNSFNFGTMSFSEKAMVGSSVYIHECETAIDLLADGRIDAHLLITSKIPLKDAVEMGFENLLTNPEKNIKVLLQIA